MSTATMWITEDQEPEITITRRNSSTGETEEATGETGVSLAISETIGGAAIGALTFTPTERGSTGIYYAPIDTATLVAGLAAYANGVILYLVWTISGDVESRSWPVKINRQRVGDD